MFLAGAYHVPRVDVLLMIIPGAAIPPEAYLNLAQGVQVRSTYKFECLLVKMHSEFSGRVA